jgi:hypothetical protein
MSLIRTLAQLRGIIPAVIFTLAGLGLAFAGNYVRQATLEEIRPMQRAQGTVVDIETVRSRRGGGDSYKPVVEYRPAGDDPIRFQTGFSGAQFLLPKKGDAVEVLYNPANPAGARLNSFLDLWMAPTALLAMGGVFALFGLGGLLRGIRAALKLIAAGAVMASRRKTELGLALNGILKRSRHPHTPNAAVCQCSFAPSTPKYGATRRTDMQ